MVLLFSILSSLGTVAVMWRLSGKHRDGWALSLGNQANWFAFMWFSEAWGLLPLNIIMTVLAVKGFVTWKK